ncbi:MAG: hypothetical protein HY088_07930 [Ignavibacteriales bacterium]|nr:hypothetical protein [Ignavibacteriales bacterium]
MKSSKSLLIPFLFLALFGGCGKNQSAPFINDDELVETYADLLVLNEQFKSPSSTMDSTQYATEFQHILAKRGMTTEQFRNQIVLQLESPQQFRQFYDKLYNTIEQKRTKS